MVWVAVQKGYNPEKTDVIVRRMIWAESGTKTPHTRVAPKRTLSLESLFFGNLKKNEDIIHALAFHKSKNDCFVEANKLVHHVYNEELPKGGPDGRMTLEEKLRMQHRAQGHYFPSQLLRSKEPINILVDIGGGLYALRRDYRAHLADLVMDIEKGTLDSLAVNQLSFHDIEYDEMRRDHGFHFSGLHLAAMIVVLLDLEECILTGKTTYEFKMLDKVALKETPARNKRRMIYKTKEWYGPKFMILNHKQEYLYLRDLAGCLPNPQRSPDGNHFTPMESGLKRMMEAHGEHLSSSPTAAEPSLPASSPATEPEGASQTGSPLSCPEELEPEWGSPYSPPPVPPPSQEIPIDLAEALLSDDFLYQRYSSSSSLGPILHPLAELWGEDLDEPTSRWSSPPLEQ